MDDEFPDLSFFAFHVIFNPLFLYSSLPPTILTIAIGAVFCKLFSFRFPRGVFLHYRRIHHSLVDKDYQMHHTKRQPLNLNSNVFKIFIWFFIYLVCLGFFTDSEIALLTPKRRKISIHHGNVDEI